MLHHLIYVSTATVPFDQESLNRLLRQSREANGIRGVSGLLIYEDGQFIQLLEGEREDVEAVFARVEKDPRHRGMTVFLRAEAAGGRLFPTWSMGYFRPRRESGEEAGLIDPDYATALERLDAQAGTPAATILTNLITAVVQRGSPGP